MKKTYYSITQQAREADVYIFGDITSYPWKPGDTSAASLVQELQELDADVINVHIDCYGGSVKEGWGIYNTLKHHKATVNTYADGFVASAALYPFLAGNNRYASAVSAFFLHEVVTSAYGYAEDLRDAAEDADKMTTIGIQAFVETTGCSEGKIKELMQKETWLDPKEALELHIATAVLAADPSQGYSQSVRKAVLQALTKPAADPAPPAPKNALKNFFA